MTPASNAKRILVYRLSTFITGYTGPNANLILWVLKDYFKASYKLQYCIYNLLNKENSQIKGNANAGYIEC